MFNKKVLLITGRTGSFGNAMLKRFLATDIAEIRIFSRVKRSRMICASSIVTTRLSLTLGMFGIFLASKTPCMMWIIFFTLQR